jgi:hypothetical protein
MTLIGACGDDVPIISTGEDGAKMLERGCASSSQLEGS